MKKYPRVIALLLPVVAATGLAAAALTLASRAMESVLADLGTFDEDALDLL